MQAHLRWTIRRHRLCGGAASTRAAHAYKVVQKTDTQIYCLDNFGNSSPILTILSLLQAEIYGA